MAETTAGFLRRAVAWYAAQGIAVERLLTDNGSAYRSTHFATVALELGIGQRFTQAYRPQTNGKAERFIRTLLTEWAYATAYGLTGGSVGLVPIVIGFFLSGDVLDNPHLAQALAFGMFVVLGLMMLVYLPLQKVSSRWMK